MNGSVTRRRPLALAIPVGLALVVVAVLLSLAFGARVVGLGEIWQGLTGAAATGGEGAIGAIAVQERVPRTVFGLLAGAALAMSGALMQAVTRNPLAEPGILGINMGAALAVVVGIAFLGISTVGQYLWLALAGAGLTAVAVYAIGSLGRGGATPIKLALAGAATTAALGSLVSAVLLPRVEVMDAFRFWQVGSLRGATWESMLTIAPLLVVGVVLAAWSAPGLNAIGLGEEVAVGLGVHVGRVRVIAGIGAVLLCGVVVAVAGPIGFVGLMIPHTVRLVIGPDQRWVLALSALGGGALLTIADTIGRVIARPGEVNVGIVTAFLGAPVLITIARRAKVRDL